MKLKLVAVGRLKEAAFRALCDDYQARISRYVRFEETEVKDDAALLRLDFTKDWLVALDVRGRAVSSPELARELEGWLASGRRQVTFVIGGAEGIPQALLSRADMRLSLSKLTLPHRLARIVLCEQIYRAFSILKNEPYAREE